MGRHCLERDAARENQSVIIGVILRGCDLHSHSNSEAQAVFGIVGQANFAHHRGSVKTERQRISFVSGSATRTRR